MRILTGLLIAKLLSGSIEMKKLKGFKGFKGVIEIKHQIPGRIRFLIPPLKNEPEKCLQLNKQLKKASQFKKILPNPITGSVLIEYDQNGIDIKTITGVLIKLLGLEKAIEERPKSVVSKEMKDVHKSLNSGIYEYTNGVIDLPSIVTTTFLGMGVYSLIRNRNIMPPGMNLLYWAYMNIQKP